MNRKTVKYAVSISGDLERDLEKKRSDLGLDHEEFLSALLSRFERTEPGDQTRKAAMRKIRDLLSEVEDVAESQIRQAEARYREKAESAETPRVKKSREIDSPEGVDLFALIAQNERLEKTLAETEKAYHRAKDEIHKLQTEVYMTENVNSQNFRLFKIEKEKELEEALDKARTACDNRVKFARAEERIIADKQLTELRKQIESLTSYSTDI